MNINRDTRRVACCGVSDTSNASNVFVKTQEQSEVDEVEEGRSRNCVELVAILEEGLESHNCLTDQPEATV